MSEQMDFMNAHGETSDDFDLDLKIEKLPPRIALSTPEGGGSMGTYEANTSIDPTG